MIKNVSKQEIKAKLKEYNTNKPYAVYEQISNLNQSTVTEWQFYNKSRYILIDFNDIGLYYREILKSGEVFKKEIYLK